MRHGSWCGGEVGGCVWGRKERERQVSQVKDQVLEEEDRQVIVVILRWESSPVIPSLSGSNTPMIL
ncbi:hypothetical protein E2C01_068647 [Portunus trituberculatus]|uniref:Uncharacterized protein n=1 Tax=Portunus trituberculatus TaxID=210409 RepID=A0A5B7HPC6_PORTR|nr:hypothetical protein [Portunus trituberculatus]